MQTAWRVQQTQQIVETNKTRTRYKLAVDSEFIEYRDIMAEVVTTEDDREK